ncbi:energy transducer TonB [Erwinia sp. INIA-01]|uniref:cell envelope integrity protein TolA n=1 Tax=Erwinia sp. INIA01 TaxID=2991500 RepID=UPI002224647A|nr:energy transducer TonB [Erwinia sp. INIA01]MCW1873998.1 energy transducer TonB [Erwinia sp. INIA01]
MATPVTFDDAQRAGTTSWLTGSLLALGLHIGAAVWLMWMPPITAADNTPPAAIMIEMADTAQAVLTERNDISPESQNSQASEEKVKEETQSDAAAAPAVDPLKQPEKEPEKAVPEAEKPDIALRAAQGAKTKKDQKGKSQQEKQKKQKQQQAQHQQQVSAKQAVQAQVQTQQAERTAAQKTNASSSVSTPQEASWAGRVMAHLEKRKRYPEAAQERGDTGTVLVRFTIDDDGNVLSASLARSSGVAELDREVLSLVKRASPVPAPPPGAQKTLTAPVAFFPKRG